jgi:hypothetical protein
MEELMLRSIAFVAVLALAAFEAEAGERARIYLDLDHGGLYGFGIDYRDQGYRDRYDGYGYYRYRYGPPYGYALGYWDRPWPRYYGAYRDGWRDGRRYERHRDRWHDRRRHRDCDD